MFGGEAGRTWNIIIGRANVERQKGWGEGSIEGIKKKERSEGEREENGGRKWAGSNFWTGQWRGNGVLFSRSLSSENEFEKTQYENTLSPILEKSLNYALSRNIFK